VTERLASVKNV